MFVRNEFSASVTTWIMFSVLSKRGLHVFLHMSVDVCTVTRITGLNNTLKRLLRRAQAGDCALHRHHADPEVYEPAGELEVEGHAIRHIVFMLLPSPSGTGEMFLSLDLASFLSESCVHV